MLKYRANSEQLKSDFCEGNAVNSNGGESFKINSLS